MKYIHFINILLISFHFLGSTDFQKQQIRKDNSIYENIKTLKPSINEKTAKKIEQSIRNHCGKHSYEIVVAILFIESSFRKNVVSPTGDIGLGQISPQSITDFNFDEKKLFQIDYNIYATCKVLASKKAYFHYHSKTHSRAINYKNKIKHEVQKMKTALKLKEGV